MSDKQVFLAENIRLTALDADGNPTASFSSSVEPKTQTDVPPGMRDVQADIYARGLAQAAVGRMTHTPPRRTVPQHDSQWIGSCRSLPESFGQSAREFEWLIKETEAFKLLVQAEARASSMMRKAALGHSVMVTRRPLPLLNTMIDRVETRKAS